MTTEGSSEAAGVSALRDGRFHGRVHHRRRSLLLDAGLRTANHQCIWVGLISSRSILVLFRTTCPLNSAGCLGLVYLQRCQCGACRFKEALEHVLAAPTKSLLHLFTRAGCSHMYQRGRDLADKKCQHRTLVVALKSATADIAADGALLLPRASLAHTLMI